jgi:tetratricopeptide (TPR) repeat protein
MALCLPFRIGLLKKLLFANLISIVIFNIGHVSYALHEELLYVARGALLEEQGKYEKAINEYERALEIDPNFVELYVSIGNIYNFKLNKKNEAIEIYKSGLQRFPNDFSLNLNIMYVYFDLNDLDNGIKHYKKLSTIRTDAHRFTFPRRIVEKMTSEMNSDEQINFYKSYISINPSDIILREYLSEVYMDKKDYQNARNEFNSMLDYGYASGTVYFGLAVCEFYLGNYHNSMKLLEKAQDMGENVPDVYFDFVKEKIDGQN